ncbi:uncharacterized protein LOC142333433 [Lycorma delicatula]|uniref:uncharacterized protein LOC142333433 n=1 Tax=Lycorma delicatula TaxID=130591 RepID=UPI003F512D13
MRILLYVMSFFIFSAENTPIGKWLFKSEKYSRHEKYPNLQNSCVTVEKKNPFERYLRDTYHVFREFKISRIFGETKLDKLKKHKYYTNYLTMLMIDQESHGDKEKQILPTLLQLLDAIPDTIIIKKGIINTEADSIVSGIDITETISTDDTNTNKQTISTDDTNSNKKTYTDISTRLPCDPMSPETSDYADVKHVVMEGSYIYAYYECKKKLKKMKFQLSDEERETKLIKKIDVPCTLRFYIADTRNTFYKNVIPVLSRNEEEMRKLKFYSKIQYEIRFSYLCKFVSPVFLPNQITQYKMINFTLSSYQIKRFFFSNPKCIGLTYCLQNQDVNYYDYNLEELFLYNFDKEEVTNGGKR